MRELNAIPEGAMAGQGPRVIYVAVDDSPHSKRAVQWAVRNTAVTQGADELHMVTVLPPPPMPVAPGAPMATAGILAAQSIEAARKRDEHEATQTLARVRELVVKMGVPEAKVHGHILPAEGGASGVAESIVDFANRKQPTLVILGSRGMGAFKRSVMSWLGLGSVGDYCVHNLHTPVAVIRKQEHEAEELLHNPEEARKVCVALDDSEAAQQGLSWTLANYLQPQDELHLIAVAQAVPFPVFDEVSAGNASYAAERWDSEKAAAKKVAEGIVDKAIRVASNQVSKERIWYRALQPEGGASDVGESILHYVRQNKVDVLVLGNRGLGALKRSMMSLIGLGSVSDYCVHNSPAPVIIVKSGAAPTAAPESA